METLLGGKVETYQKKSDLRSSLCYYISIILVLLAFIFSCISLGFCSAVSFRDMLLTFRSRFRTRYTATTSRILRTLLLSSLVCP